MKTRTLAVWLLATLVMPWFWPSPSVASPAAPTDRRLPRLMLWDRVLRERWEKTERLLEEADALLKKRKYAQSVGRLEEALRIRPDAASLWFGLGTVHSFAGNYPDCVKALSRCRVLDPKLREDLVAFRMALCLSLSGRIAAGIAEYQKVSSREVSPAILHWNLGDNFMALGRLVEAATQYETALRHAPGRAVLHLALAVTLHRQGKRPAALRRAKLAVRLDADGRSLGSDEILWLPAHEHHYYRAVHHLAAGERAQALAQWQRFVAADPESPWRHVMGLAAAELTTRALAEEDIRQVKGTLDQGQVAATLTTRQAALSRCLGTATGPVPLSDLRGVSMVIILDQGRLGSAEVNATAGELPSKAAACLRAELGRVSWSAVATGRDAVSFTLELAGP